MRVAVPAGHEDAQRTRGRDTFPAPEGRTRSGESLASERNFKLNQTKRCSHLRKDGIGETSSVHSDDDDSLGEHLHGLEEEDVSRAAEDRRNVYFFHGRRTRGVRVDDERAMCGALRA
eukprot:749636-Hanusia_phi.AAC.2